MGHTAIGTKQALTGTLIVSGGHTGAVGRAMDGTSLGGGATILAGFLSGNKPLTVKGASAVEVG